MNELDIQQIKRIIEATIMAANGEPVSIKDLQRVFLGAGLCACPNQGDHGGAPLQDAINQLQQDYHDRGIELQEVASGYRFQVKTDLMPWVSKLWAEGPPRYSRAMLETLALIAYRQPITRAEIEDIRGVSVSSNIIRTLLDHEWVKVAGYKQVPGKPAFYVTTDKLLDHFNLKSLQELPPLGEIHDLDQAASQLELSLEIKNDENHMVAVKPVNFISENAKIAADLYLPADAVNKKLPGIILCHGFAAVKELFLPAFAKKFAEHGYAVLAFDYRGFGKSEGEVGRLVPKLQIEDIKNAITFLAAQPEVDSERIGLWGTSYGGANVIMVASEDPRVKCICAQLTFGDGERVITGNMPSEDATRLKEMIAKMQQRKTETGKEMMVPIVKILSDPQSLKFYQDNIEAFPELNIKIPYLTVAETLNYKPEQYLSQVKVPILIVGASQDGVNPVTESEHLYELAGEPKELFIVQGATHFEVYAGEYFQQTFAKELEWYNKYLKVMQN